MKNVLLLFIFLTSKSINSQCWQFISAGFNHNIAIQQDGTLWTWGLNTDGQLGDGTNISKNIPTQIGSSTDWVYVSAGENFTYAIKQNGAMYAWGKNNRGQLSDGTLISRNIPAQVGTTNDWAKVECSSEFVVAQKTDGTLWSCGNNNFVQLGLGLSPTAMVYQLTQVNTDTDWLSFSLGYRHVVLLKNNHVFWSWGEGASGKIGTGSNAGSGIPIHPYTINNWEQVTSSFNGTLYKKNDGTIWAIGQNQSGALGFGNYQINNFNLQQIGTANDWNSVESSEYCTMAIKNNGTLWSCGYNNAGQLGNGTTTQSNVLAQVGTQTNWMKIRCGLFHTIALTDTGTLMAWGDNQYGQLGDGTTVDKLIPVQIGSTCNLANALFESEKIKVFPNPVENVLNISIFSNELNNFQVNVFNSLGQIVLSNHYSNIDNNQLQIDCSELVKGFYIIEVSSPLKTYKSKFLKD